MKARSLLLVFFVFLIFSCATEIPYAARPLEQVTLGQIRNKLSAGEAISALQDLSALSLVRQLPKEAVDTIHADAVAEVRDQLFRAVEGKNYVDAYAFSRSLEFLGDSGGLDGWDSFHVLGELAAAFKEEGFSVASLVLRLRLADVAPDPIAFYTAIATDAEEAGLASIGRYAVEQLGNLGLASPAAAVAPEKRRMIEGTVTIWVNRGMKIEHGIGYPDRVIGSGFFVGRDGYLVTNYHVIESEVDPAYEGFSRLFIRTANDDSVRIPAKVVGWDRIFDLALLKVDMKANYVFSPSVVEANRPGDRIYAIGSPAGLTNTITSGIVSATDRRFFQMGEALQVDVPVNPGNSGGPLINDNGDLVGVVFAGIEQFEGINFAIPSRWIKVSLPRMFLGGEVSYPWMGAAVAEVPEGLEVLYVVPGEPACNAGIRSGDILVSVAGTASSRINETQAAMTDLVPGTLIPVVWTRSGERFSGSVALSGRPAHPVDRALERDIPISLVEPLFGMALERTSRSLLGDSYLVTRVIPGGVADNAGFSVSDPLRLEDLSVDTDNRQMVLTVVVKKRKAGFIERAIKIGAYLEIDSFL